MTITILRKINGNMEVKSNKLTDFLPPKCASNCKLRQHLQVVHLLLTNLSCLIGHSICNVADYRHHVCLNLDCIWEEDSKITMESTYCSFLSGRLVDMVGQHGYPMNNVPCNLTYITIGKCNILLLLSKDGKQLALH
jgi:hypothetical protein